MQIGRSLGHSMELLDVGGGFPSDQLNSNVVNALSATCNDPLGYRVIAEPGRHFSSNTCHLAFRVHLYDELRFSRNVSSRVNSAITLTNHFTILLTAFLWMVWALRMIANRSTNKLILKVTQRSLMINLGAPYLEWLVMEEMLLHKTWSYQQTWMLGIGL